MTKSAAEAARTPAIVEIEWQSGAPAAINGVEMPLVDLIDSLETIAGVHGVGRIGAAESRPAGQMAHETIEAPAALVLHSAHRGLETMVTPTDLQRLKQPLSKEYVRIVDNGLWFSPARSAIDAFVQNVQPRVTGMVRMKLDKGQCQVVGRRRRCARSRPATDDAGDCDFGGGGFSRSGAARRPRRSARRRVQCAPVSK